MSERYRLRFWRIDPVEVGDRYVWLPRDERPCVFDEVVEGYVTTWLEWEGFEPDPNDKGNWPCLAVTNKGPSRDIAAFGDMATDAGYLVVAGMPLADLMPKGGGEGYAVQWEPIA